MLSLIKSRKKEGGSKGKRGKSIERREPELISNNQQQLQQQSSFDDDYGTLTVADTSLIALQRQQDVHQYEAVAQEPPVERPESRSSQSGAGGGAGKRQVPKLGTSAVVMNTYLFEDDPGIMSEVETSSTRHKTVKIYEGHATNGRATPTGKNYYNQHNHGYSSSLHDDDPGIMSEAETASTTRGHHKQRQRSRNSIPMGTGGGVQGGTNHHPGVVQQAQKRTVQFRHPIIQTAAAPNLFEDDPGIMSEAETSSTPGRRRQLLRSNSGGGGSSSQVKPSYKNKEFIQPSQKHALPVVRTPSKTLERPLGLVFLVYRGETKRALLPNEITSIFTVKALFVRSFGDCLTMEFMDAPNVKIYIHDSAKDIFYELENLTEIKDRTILKLFEGDKGPSGLGPGGLPPITNDEVGTDDMYVDARQVKALKVRTKEQQSSKTLPRNAFSTASAAAIDQAVPTAAMMQQLPDGSGGRRMTERSKTLGPGFMRGMGGQLHQQPHYSPHQPQGDDSVIPSRFSTMPESGRYYTGPGSTEEAKERMMHMEAQLSQLTGMVEKALKNKKLGKKTVSFDKAVSFSDDHLKPPGILTNKNRRAGGYNSSSNHYHHTPQNSTAAGGAASMSPDMYNQLRGLQRTAKDLRQEVKIIRRLTMLQSMAMKDLVQDTYLKLREACITFNNGPSPGGANGADLEGWRVAQDEDLFQRELNDLVQQISQLEAKVEEMRSGVINKKNKIGLADVESMSNVLTKCSKTVTHLKQAFPTLERHLKAGPAYQAYTAASDKTRAPAPVLMTEEFLRRTPERLESVWKRCKKLTGTLVTLKRLASVQEQRFHPGASMNDLSLSPTPPGGVEGGATAAAGALKKESTLDDLLDALQSYSGSKKDQAIIRQKGNYILQQLQHQQEVKESPAKKANSKTAPPPPPPRTSSTGGKSSGSGGGGGSRESCSGSESTASDSSESINSQEGLKQTRVAAATPAPTVPAKPHDLSLRQEALESRHQELLTRQKQLQEQYERLQQMQQKKAQAKETATDTAAAAAPPKTAAVKPLAALVSADLNSLGSSGNETEESSNPEEENSSSSTSGNAPIVLPVMGKEVGVGGGKPNRPVGRVPPALPARGNSTLTTVTPRITSAASEQDGNLAASTTNTTSSSGNKKVYETDMI